MAKVLAIGGSDPSAGAGVQADLKTATALGAYATTVLTAVTAQNTSGVRRADAIDPEMVEAQLRAVLEDMGADAIKTGMLANAAIVASIARVLSASAPGVPLIIDPVMVAKGGRALLDDAGRRSLVDMLLPLATLVTPNAEEAAMLVGFDVTTEDAMVRAGEAILRLGASAVLVKGGHVAGDEVLDVLVQKDAAAHVFRGARLATRGPRGTGCTLATAIATRLAQGSSLVAAIEDARAFVRSAIASEIDVGRGHPVLDHTAASASRGQRVP